MAMTTSPIPSVASAAAIAIIFVSCARPLLPPAAEMVSASAGAAIQATDPGLAIAQRYRVAAIAERRFTHREFWRAVAPSLRSDALMAEEIGRSMLGREIRSVTFGQGPTKVLLWSQMHGDEATATMALADIFRFFSEAQGDSLRERLRRELTVVFVPMLNPDGAELFQRENAAGIDVNRDGRQLSTPEARALKALRDRVNPHFGFNLHDQNARTRAGGAGLPVGIALLAPATDISRSYNETRARARLVAATIVKSLEPHIAGRIAKYDDAFNVRAFGDLMQQWGTSTVLIESGALPDDPQKQRLRALNVVAILTALDAIATRGYENANPDSYESLPRNQSGASDLLILGGQLVIPGAQPMLADIAINFDDPVAKTGGRVRDVGDLRETIALDTLDARELFVHPGRAALTRRSGGSWLQLGAPAALDVRRGAGGRSELVRRLVGK